MTERVFEQIWYCTMCQHWGSVCKQGAEGPTTFPLLSPARACVLRDHARVSPQCGVGVLVGEQVGLRLHEQAGQADAVAQG